MLEFQEKSRFEKSLTTINDIIQKFPTQNILLVRVEGSILNNEINKKEHTKYFEDQLSKFSKSIILNQGKSNLVDI